MAAIWRSKPRTGPTDLAQIQSTILPLFAGLGAYPETSTVEDALIQYYTTHTPVDSIPPNV